MLNDQHLSLQVRRENMGFSQSGQERFEQEKRYSDLLAGAVYFRLVRLPVKCYHSSKFDPVLDFLLDIELDLPFSRVH